MILAYSGIELGTKEGLKVLLDFARGCKMMDSPVENVINQLVNIEEAMVEEATQEYYDTLRSAMPNCFD